MGVLDIGLRDDVKKESRSKIRLSNLFALITTIVFMLTSANNFILKDLFSGYLLIFLALLSLITFFINLISNSKIAFIYLFSVISLAVFYFDSYSGIKSGSFLYYFPLALAIANIFDFKTQKDRLIMLVQYLFIGALIVTNILTDHALFVNPNFTDAQKSTMFAVNTTLSTLSLAFFVYLIVKSNLTKMHLLEVLVEEESQRRALEEEKNRTQNILLAELQHRLKNNLSLMSSLLKLKLENTQDINYPIAFKESIHAIQTVAQANHLQVFKDGAMILPLDRYVEEIVLYWNQLLNDEFPIKGDLDVSCQEIQLHVKQAVPLGIILHEWISLFWSRSFLLNVNESLIIDIKQKKNIIFVYFHCSISDLIKLNQTKDAIVESLADQIDAKISVKSPNEMILEIEQQLDSPFLESETVFKK